MEELRTILLNSKAKLEKELKTVIKMLKTLGVTTTKGGTRRVSAATRKKMAEAKKAYWAKRKKAEKA
jgi:hypothetical protein